MSLVSEIGSYLATQSVGVVGTNLFEGLMPESPGSCVTLNESSGRMPVRAMARTVVATQPHLVVTVRDADYETAYTKARSIEVLLQNFAGTIGSVVYYDITALGAINSLGTDENNRFRLTQMFLVLKEPS
jgi:hypothetical protein